MHPLHAVTPLLRHGSLLLKMESLQASGSFKLRGIGLFCQRAVGAGAHKLVCPSGGNAGFAAAVAGVALGVPTTIVVPQTTPASVVEKIRAIGAEVLVYGSVWDQANELALQMCVGGAVYVPPFDHVDIWDGNATLIDEAVAQSRELGVDFDVVICSVGGGGLMCGVLEGLHRNGLEHIPLIAVETEGAASLAASVAAGELVSLPAITSIASSLGARKVAVAALAWTRRHDVRVVTVSDAQAVSACLRFADELRTLVEPACGAALAVPFEQLPALAGFRHPLVVVCGGIGTDIAKLSAWSARFA